MSVARIRSVKPEMHDDERVAGLSDTAFRVWMFAITQADDLGNLRGSVRWLTSRIWWGREPGGDVEAARAELISCGLVSLYEVNGEPFLSITSWSKHQRIDNAGKPAVPPPPAEIRRESPRTAANRREPPLEGRGEERRGLEGKGEDAREDRAPSLTGPVAAVVAEIERIGPPLWSHPYRQQVTKVVRALVGDGILVPQIISAWARYVADAYWRPKGCPPQRFRDEFPKYAAEPSAPKPSADEKRRAVGRPSSDWRVCECGHPAARYHDGGRCKATSCGCEAFRESAEEVTA